MEVVLWNPRPVAEGVSSRPCCRSVVCFRSDLSATVNLFQTACSTYDNVCTTVICTRGDSSPLQWRISLPSVRKSLLNATLSLTFPIWSVLGSHT
jgi:hypothetical protein